MNAGMDPLDGLSDDLEAQREYVRSRVPVYERILGLSPDVLPRDRLAAAWQGRAFGAWYERPLLILAALRDDALEEGPEHPLYGAIGDGPGLDSDGGGEAGDNRARVVTRAALQAALEPGRPVWAKLRSRHVQTNETSRAVAWLWPAHLVATADPRCTLHLFDVGASAGLNLVGDALPRIWTRPGGEPLATNSLPEIGTRRGYDLRPLDPDGPEDARWLRACVWPGQRDRLQRLEAAIRAWRSIDPRAELVRAAAGDVPGRLPTAAGGRRLAFQTVMRDYLSPDEWERYEPAMGRWLDAHPPGGALWIELEVTEEARVGGPPAAITVHLSDTTLQLATCDPHPRVLDVDDVAVQELLRRLG